MATICAVALILMLDGSGSMNRDFHTQREETARAVESYEVVDAIERSGAVAISVMQFAGQTRTEVGWQVLQSTADARALAEQIRNIRFLSGGDTRIANAMTSGLEHMNALTTCVPDQQIIDISTDGIDADVRGMEAARDAAQIAGVRINVIAVSQPEDAELMREYVMTPDGFVLHTTTWADYPQLFRRKIIFELAGLLPWAP